MNVVGHLFRLTGTNCTLHYKNVYGLYYSCLEKVDDKYHVPILLCTDTSHKNTLITFVIISDADIKIEM